jgi:mannose-6-phosphate isomerase-like protein (cupin superfamily)
MSAVNGIDLLTLARQAKINRRGSKVATFDGHKLGISRFSRHPRWEMHPSGDELLQVIDGELELTLLGEKERTRITLKPGFAFIVPRGVWHSPNPRGIVALLHMADYSGTVVSDGDDPRHTR